MTFLEKLTLAVKTNESVEVEGDIIGPRFARLILELRDSMWENDREEFFSQEPREILGAIRLSLSGGA